MVVKLVSFGYEFGVPKNNDRINKIFNIQSFPSPSASTCSKYNGTHKQLQNEIIYKDQYQVFIQDILNYIESSTSSNSRNDKDYAKDDDITIAIGCSHGRHRSVAVVEFIFANHHQKIDAIYHRDLDRRKQKMKRQEQISKLRNQKYQINNNDND